MSIFIGFYKKKYSNIIMETENKKINYIKIIECIEKNKETLNVQVVVLTIFISLL
jgi:hypothetical protein